MAQTEHAYWSDFFTCNIMHLACLIILHNVSMHVCMHACCHWVCSFARVILWQTTSLPQKLAACSKEILIFTPLFQKLLWETQTACTLHANILHAHLHRKRQKTTMFYFLYLKQVFRNPYARIIMKGRNKCLMWTMMQNRVTLYNVFTSLIFCIHQISPSTRPL